MENPTPSVHRRRPYLLWAALALLILGGGVIVFLAVFKPQPLYQSFGTRLVSARPAYDFSLINHSGQTIRLSDLKGKAVFVFFGFVNCPDVCPTTMLELGKVYKALKPDEQARLQVIMITADPERDTPEVLGKYVSFFHPSFLGLTGSLEQVRQTAEGYGVFFQKENIKSPKEYAVAHTASTFLIDPKGNLSLIYAYGKTKQTEKVIRDVRWVLR